jgi:hypothetical protein
MAITQLQQGHHRSNRVQHVRPQSAVPWTETDVVIVVRSMADRLATADRAYKLALYRDITIVCFLWETQNRGSNAGRTANLRYSTGRYQLRAQQPPYTN